MHSSIDSNNDDDELNNNPSTHAPSWKKGEGTSTDDRINHWSLNGFGEPVFTGGLYTHEDIDTLETAVKDYCASRNVTPQELCSEKHFKAVRGAWNEIAQSLPHRTVLSVYRRALRQFSGHTTGKWSEEELASLSRLVELHGHKWKTIQDKLGRSAHYCRSKFLEMNDEFERGRWSVEKIELLLKTIRDALDVPRSDMDVREINQFTLDNNSKIPWTVVSFRVMRGMSDCYMKWKQMTRRSNKIAATLGLEPIPMARTSLKFDVKMEYYRWKAEQDPKWRKKYADKYIIPLLRNNADEKATAIQLDDSLLDKVIQSKANRLSEMSWHSIRDMPNGVSSRERFDELVDEYAPNEAMDLPLWQLAKIVRERFNKFVMAGNNDVASDSNTTSNALRPKKKSVNDPQPERVQSNPNNGRALSALEINTDALKRNISEVFATVDSNKVTMKGVRKLLEKQMGIKLRQYKDQIKEIVMEML
jgi:hypothetical protein